MMFGRRLPRGEISRLVRERRSPRVIPFHSAGATTATNASPERRDSNAAKQPPERWKLAETLLMVAAALRVMVPYLLIVIVAVFAAWGLWRVVFR